jgi:hypothetical protein
MLTRFSLRALDVFDGFCAHTHTSITRLRHGASKRQLAQAFMVDPHPKDAIKIPPLRQTMCYNTMRDYRLAR